MKKSDLLQAVIEAVAQECELSPEAILSKSRKEDLVDARHIVVKLLADRELYPSQIAELTGMSARYINLILNDFTDRRKRRKFVGINYELSRKKLGMNYFTDEPKR